MLSLFDPNCCTCHCCKRALAGPPKKSRKMKLHQKRCKRLPSKWIKSNFKQNMSKWKTESKTRSVHVTYMDRNVSLWTSGGCAVWWVKCSLQDGYDGRRLLHKRFEDGQGVSTMIAVALDLLFITVWICVYLSFIKHTTFRYGWSLSEAGTGWRVWCSKLLYKKSL